MQFVTGSYTGDGNDDRWINTVGFLPNLVLVKGDTSAWAVWRTSTMAAGDCAYFTRYRANFPNAIQAFGANGFQVGTDVTVNANGVVYYYSAFRDTGGDDFQVGTYTGDGNDDRNIVGLGFRPTVVWTKADDTEPAVWRIDENIGDDSLHFLSPANAADNIQGFVADGFQVGTDNQVNELNSVYHYAAFCDAVIHIQTGSYVGNGNDNRNITCGLSAGMVWVKGDLVAASHLRIDTMDAGDSAPHADVAPVGNRIQAFAATTFQIGTSATVNQLGATYYWATWAAGPAGLTPFRRTVRSSGASRPKLG